MFALKKFIALVLLFLCSGLQAAERPNIVWIISDDLSPELGCYGYDGVNTPNIDKLATQGVRYTHAFSTAPVCSAARTAMITGMYQTSINGFHHNTRKKTLLEKPIEPITEKFRRAGYFVTVGYPTPELKKNGKTHFNFIYKVKEMYDGYDWSQRKEGQPFFSQIHIKEPHRAYKSSGRSGEGLKIPPFYPEHPLTRADWADYLAAIETLDDKVGTVLKRLEDEGLAENTLVMFFGDHGRPHVRGKQWLYDGGIHIPLIIRWPGKMKENKVVDGLVSMLDFAPTTLSAAGLEIPEYMKGLNLLDPNVKYHEKVYAARDRCGDAIDRIRCVRTEKWKYIRNYHPEISYSNHSGYKKLVYPILTLMAVMHKQGRLNGPAADWFADTKPKEELYDLESDPWEMKNLAADPCHAETLKKLRADVENWVIETKDQGGETEGDEEYIKNLLAEKWKYYERTMKRRGLDPNLTDREYLDWLKKEAGLKK